MAEIALAYLIIGLTLGVASVWSVYEPHPDYSGPQRGCYLFGAVVTVVLVVALWPIVLGLYLGRRV